MLHRYVWIFSISRGEPLKINKQDFWGNSSGVRGNRKSTDERQREELEGSWGELQPCCSQQHLYHRGVWVTYRIPGSIPLLTQNLLFWWGPRSESTSLIKNVANPQLSKAGFQRVGTGLQFWASSKRNPREHTGWGETLNAEDGLKIQGPRYRQSIGTRSEMKGHESEQARPGWSWGIWRVSKGWLTGESSLLWSSSRGLWARQGWEAEVWGNLDAQCASVSHLGNRKQAISES